MSAPFREPARPPVRPLAAWSQARSHPGVRRAVNQDRVVDLPGHGFWAVADGMGGMADGEVAAERVTEAIAAAAAQAGSGYVRLNLLVAALERVNADLYGAAVGPREPTGSTVVALLVHDGHYACLWAGDSRAYLYRKGRLSQLTHDHSVVQQMIDDGVVLDDLRRSHPFSHVLTRAVGAEATLEIDRRFGAVEPDDLFLLCSDGLTNALSEAEIRDALDNDLADAADVLIDRALRRDAADNVSCVLVRQS